MYTSKTYRDNESQPFFVFVIVLRTEISYGKYRLNNLQGFLPVIQPSIIRNLFEIIF